MAAMARPKMAAALRRSSSLPEGSRVFAAASNAELKTSTEDLLHLEPSPSGRRPQARIGPRLKDKVCAAVHRAPQIQYQLILFVLFISILSLVSLTYYYSHVQKKESARRDRIEIEDRALALLGAGGQTLLTAKLGLGFTNDWLGIDCRLLYPSRICTEWKYRARLTVNFSSLDDALNCYSFHWVSLAPYDPLKDCFLLKGAAWYGIGDTKNSTWPFRGHSNEMRPFVTGNASNDDLGSLIERYWLSSEGIAIWVDPEVPLFFSMNSSHLCFESRAKTFPYLTTEVPSLSYHICSGPNIRKVHESMIRHFFPKSTNQSTSLDFLEQPIWATDPKLGSSINQYMLQNHANRIMEHGLQKGWVLVESGWQKGVGDLVFNNDTFDKPEDIISILHNKGFKVLLNVNPYVCLSSDSFSIGAEEKLFILDSTWEVPLLTRWNGEVCAILNFFSPRSFDWFYNQLASLQEAYLIDGFFFSGGETLKFPRSFVFPGNVTNPDQLIPSYFGNQTIGSSLSFRSQDMLAFVRLSPRPSTWDGLKTVIPSVLSLGLIGYPLVNAGSVGGDTSSKPPKELYLRWLQLSAFLPVVQYSVPPGDYDLDGIKAAKILFKLREDKVMPALKKAYKEYLETGAPMIRPLWWESPNELSALNSDSQFLIGDSILVAPVLENGSKSRDIYLPSGMWHDEVQGHSQRGGKWIYNYQVPLDKVVYFTKSKEK